MTRGLLRFGRSLVSARGASAAAAQTMLVRCGLIGINVLTGIISARLLGPAGKGAQTAIITWFGIANIFASCGLPTALVYHARSRPYLQGRFFAAALIAAIAVGLLTAAVAYIVIPYSLSRFDPQFVRAAQLFMIFVPLYNLFLIAQSIIEAHLQFAVENALSIASTLLTLLSMLVLGIFGAATPITIAICYTVPGIPAVLAGLIYAARRTRPDLRGVLGPMRELVSFGARQYGTDLAAAFSANLDIILVSSLLPAQIVGTYAVTVSLCRMLNLVQQSISVVLLPNLIGQPLATICGAVERAARIGIAISLVIAVPIAFAGNDLLKLLYGAGFVINPLVIWILLVDTVLGGVSRILMQTIIAVGRPGLAALLNAVQICVGVPLSLLLLRQFGIAGLAGGMLLATTVRLGITILCYPRVLGVASPRLLLSGSDLASLYLRLRAVIE